MASYAVKLRSGSLMPLIGLGTSKASAEDTKASILSALEIGYRHIDTAFNYKNEKVIGEALKIAFDKGLVKRSDLFITSKVPYNGLQPDKVTHFLKRSMDDLQVTYLDLYLIHWPIVTQYVSDEETLPFRDGKLLIDNTANHLDAWKVMESLVEKGLVRNIGLSNFNSEQTKNVYDHAKIKPSNLQIEGHVYLQQEKLFKFCRNLGISVTAYAPLGSQKFREFLLERGDAVIPEQVSALADPIVNEIAKSKGKTAAQIALRFLVQRGIIVIPKSVTPSRLKENFEIFNFDLTEEEMVRIKSVDRGVRYFSLDYIKEFLEHPLYPFNSEF